MTIPSPAPDTSSPVDPGAGVTTAVTGFYTWRVTGILISLALYLSTLLMAALAPRYLAPGGTLEFVLLSPLLALLLVVCITYLAYRASDDNIRHRILRCAVLTGVILAFSTLGYFGLERLGYPRLSMIVVNLYGWSVFTVQMLRVLYRAR